MCRLHHKNTTRGDLKDRLGPGAVRAFDKGTDGNVCVLAIDDRGPATPYPIVLQMSRATEDMKPVEYAEL